MSSTLAATLATLATLVLGVTIALAEGQRPINPSTASMDGASPPAVLSSAQRIALKRILARYRSDTLNAEDVRAIRRELEIAGLKSGPALDAALAREGLSRKRMETLLPATPNAPEAPANPAGRKFPRPQ